MPTSKAYFPYLKKKNLAKVDLLSQKYAHLIYVAVMQLC